MLTFLMSARARPYLASNSSSKMRVVERLRAQQADVEHESACRPCRSCGPTSPAAPTTGSSSRPGPAAREPALRRPRSIGERVGRVRVAAAGRGEDLVLVGGHAGLGLPRRAVAFEVATRARRRCSPRARGPRCRMAPTRGRRPGRSRGPPDRRWRGRGRCRCRCRTARHLAGPAEEVLVGLGLPAAEARAGPGAGRAALLSVDAVGQARALPRGGTACSRPRSGRSR